MTSIIPRFRRLEADAPLVEAGLRRIVHEATTARRTTPSSGARRGAHRAKAGPDAGR